MELEYGGNYFEHKLDYVNTKITREELIKLSENQNIELEYNAKIKNINGKKVLVNLVEVKTYAYIDGKLEEDIEDSLGNEIINSLEWCGFDVKNLNNDAKKIGIDVIEYIEKNYSKLKPRKFKRLVNTQYYIYE